MWCTLHSAPWESGRSTYISAWVFQHFKHHQDIPVDSQDWPGPGQENIEHSNVIYLFIKAPTADWSFYVNLLSLEGRRGRKSIHFFHYLTSHIVGTLHSTHYHHQQRPRSFITEILLLFLPSLLPFKPHSERQKWGQSDFAVMDWDQGDPQIQSWVDLLLVVNADPGQTP